MCSVASRPKRKPAAGRRFPRTSGRHLAAGLWGVIALVGCGGGGGATEPPPPPPPPPPALVLTTVEITPGSASFVSIGETTSLSASARDQNGDPINASFVWRTLNAAVAVVNASGTVTAVDNGSTTITATADGISGQATVTVDQIPAALVLLTQPSGAFEGRPFDVQPVVEVQDARANTVSNDNGTLVTAAVRSGPAGAAVTGTSAVTASAGLVAFVDLGLNVTGAGVTLDFSSGSLPAVVTQPFDVLAVPASVTVDPGQLEFSALGDQGSLTATASRADGTSITEITSFTWESSDVGIADVDDSGLVEAKGNGTVEVTASAGGVRSAPVTVTVQQVASSLVVVPELSVVGIGATATFQVQAWDSRNNPIPDPQFTVAVVDAGVLTAVGNTLTGVASGTSDFTVTSGPVSEDGRAAVVPPDGFAALVAQDRTQATVPAGTGSTLQVRLMLIRPAGGTGSLGSLQGRIEWDPSHLAFSATQNLGDGFTWVPNSSDAASLGQLLFSAFSATGNSTVGADVDIAELTFSVIGAAGAVSAFQLVLDVVGSTTGDIVTDKVQVVNIDLEIGS